MNEFTGNYYKCKKCFHFWDYNDTACPECGSFHYDEKSLGEEIEDTVKHLDSLRRMKDLHQC